MLKHPAQMAGVRQLVQRKLVPSLPSVFLDDPPEKFDGPIIVGKDGMFFSLLP